MEQHIERRIRNAIGGDAQRLHEMRTSFRDLSFQYWLLPVWVSAYRFRGRLHQFVVNATTGEVQGDRPWSPWKLAAVALTALACIATLAWLATQPAH